MIISDFTKKELDWIIARANFTKDQEQLFSLRSKGVTLEECAEIMNVSVSTAKRISAKVNTKIIKVC